MPIAITSEHQDLAESVRSLVARVAPSEVLHAALELRRRGGGVGAAALCGGGGQGDALIIRVPAKA